MQLHHIVHDQAPNTAILIKRSALQKQPILDKYITPSGLKAVSFSLDYGGKKKPSAKTIHEYLEDHLLPAIDSLGITDLLVADGEYFKKLVGVQKSEPHYGSVMPVKKKGFEHMNAVLVPNHQALMYNPNLQAKIDLGLQAMVSYQNGSYQEIGKNIIKSEDYPSELNEIRKRLDSLLLIPSLTCDIETFDLKHYLAGIGSIGFSWDSSNGTAFSVDYCSCPPEEIRVWDRKDKKYKKKIAVGRQVKNEPVRALLKEFFEKYEGTLIWHNASFDITVLIYQLWMDDLLDQEGLLKGLEVMTRNFECTKIITYLATNNCAGNKLGLKEQAHEFAGNYAEDEINNIRLIPEPALLRYNLIDCLCTWYVMDKHYDTMVLDEQYDLYIDLMKPHLIDIIQMQLTGMCLDMPQVHKAEKQLQAIHDKHLNGLLNHPAVIKYTTQLRAKYWTKDFEDRKSKAKNPEKIQPKDLSAFDDLVFNPNSGVQLQELLYDLLELPVIDTTKTGAPATGGKTLKKLSKLIQDESLLKLIGHLRDFIGVNKILTSFIPTFKEAPQAKDGKHYLFGSFILGGTVSGRLSSKNPNLQQIPSGSDYAKVIKKCFVAPKGWIFCGADFNALEDRINTLLTSDPNKEKVLLDGYDGHSFRTYHFWPHKFTHINPDDPNSINTIQDDHDADRSRSKPVHFAMQYQGTWMTLVKNCGFSDDEAKEIEGNYHTLYKVSFDWVKSRLKEASAKGYATAAFGLRIRAPVMARTLYDTNATPKEAAAEARTLGNAISGQSYGLLNGRASIELMRKVRKHPKMRTAIKQCAHIHDAQYFYIKDDLEVIEWLNRYLPEAMGWQDLPELQHSRIKLPAELDLYYPSWADSTTLPNGLNQKEIVEVCQKEAVKRKEKSLV
ncbi:DNA-directed DNA polymerase [Vibrio phage vB_VhaP_PG11]|nr:DNA-directed DNA polymerase [Vibrio phage vB_VhaP_PG11]